MERGQQLGNFAGIPLTRVAQSQRQLPTLAEVRQHNALINSPFTLSTLEWRAFTALLHRISPTDAVLKEHFIPAAELVDVGTGGGKAYAQIVELSAQMTRRQLRVEQLGTRGERLRQPDYRIIPLLALASYVKKQGGLVLVLNPLFTPYLLQLAEKGNFTKSRVAELRHLKSGYAFKLYWLLSEYRAFGTRTFTPPELRFRLGLPDDEYAGRFDNFKAKVLDRARAELAKTDLAFELVLLRKGRAVEQIRFTFNARSLPAEPVAAYPPPAAEAPAATEPEAWAQQLRAQGVGREGCALVRRQLAEGHYPVAYLDYVLAMLRRPRKSPVRKPADYLFKCITGKLLLEEYQRSQVAAPVAAGPARRRVAPSPPAETVVPLAEARRMYEQPGPFVRRSERAATFEEHVQRIYLRQGFVLEDRAGQPVLVLRPGQGDRPGQPGHA